MLFTERRIEEWQQGQWIREHDIDNPERDEWILNLDESWNRPDSTAQPIAMDEMEAWLKIQFAEDLSPGEVRLSAEELNQLEIGGEHREEEQRLYEKEMIAETQFLDDLNAGNVRDCTPEENEQIRIELEEPR